MHFSLGEDDYVYYQYLFDSLHNIQPLVSFQYHDIIILLLQVKHLHEWHEQRSRQVLQ